MSTSNITILIVEDDPIIAQDLKFYMEDFGYSPFPVVAKAEDALLLLKNVTPDCMILDVSLDGDMDGIELAEAINKHYSIPIVYLTAHHDRVTIDRIKATQPSAYLVKPIQEYNLQTSIELALYNHSHKTPEQNTKALDGDDFVSGDHFFIKVKNQLKKVLLTDIDAFEAYDNYSFVYTGEQKLIIGSTLKSIEERLKDFQFIRIHRSYVVNLQSIQGIEDDIVFLPQLKIPIGKTYKEDFMKRIQLL